VNRYPGQENNMGDAMWNVPVSSSDTRMVWTEENKSETSTSMYRADDRTVSQNGVPNETYERVNLNTRLKTMILNKQQQQQMNHQMQQYNQQVSGTVHFRVNISATKNRKRNRKVLLKNEDISGRMIHMNTRKLN
jgi:hypothetical protein